MTSFRVSVQPAMFQWARERSRIEPDVLAKRFPQLAAWERGEKQPTLKQLEAFAKATHTATGYYFGSAGPPDDSLPIQDFRTIASAPSARPSGDLLDTVYLCQNRQWWYEEYARREEEDPWPFVGSATLRDPIEKVASQIRETLGFDLEERKRLGAWTDALRCFIEQAEEAGILVMVSGVVGNNTRRKLDPAEFRSFALADPLAPVIFINSADTKAAQMFTLAHELAHIWLGETGLSDSEAREAPADRVERWCNEVAAELLVPLEVLRKEHQRDAALRSELDRLARRFKVSTLVVLRRLRDAGYLCLKDYGRAYDNEFVRLRKTRAWRGGGNFYLTLSTRVSKRFAWAIVVSTLGGRSSFTDMFYLLGFKKMRTFHKLAESLGIEHGLPP